MIWDGSDANLGMARIRSDRIHLWIPVRFNRNQVLNPKIQIESESILKDFNFSKKFYKLKKFD